METVDWRRDKVKGKERRKRKEREEGKEKNITRKGRNYRKSKKKTPENSIFCIRHVSSTLPDRHFAAFLQCFCFSSPFLFHQMSDVFCSSLISSLGFSLLTFLFSSSFLPAYVLLLFDVFF